MDYVIEGFKAEFYETEKKIEGLSEDIVVKFAANAYVGVWASWLKNWMPSPPQTIAKELGILMERIL
jgi:hypothetical protein